jgi:hypothetical protein
VHGFLAKIAISYAHIFDFNARFAWFLASFSFG